MSRPRQELPGRRWYFASCQNCRWLGLDWKDKNQAKLDRDNHNAAKHAADATEEGEGR